MSLKIDISVIVCLRGRGFVGLDVYGGRGGG